MEKRREYEIAKIRLSGPSLHRLERLCNAVGVAGDEAEVRKIVLSEVNKPASLVRNVQIDALGNVLVTHDRSAEKRLRVMVAAHMDEVGMMLTQEENGSLFRFELIGGIDKRALVGKALWIGKEHIPGVIGAKPIHFVTSKDDLKNPIPVEELRIDISPGSKGKVKVGDRATFATTFQKSGPSLQAKALDDRLGVALLLELLQMNFTNIDLMAAFTVQEEVGLRGAGVAAYALQPDIAIVIDCTPAYDQPNWEDDKNQADESPKYNSRLGEGAAIYVADGRTFSHPRLVRFFVDTAERLHIPYQIRQPGGGGTDAGAIHLQRAGIPTISISVPARYTHTATSLARQSDWENTLALVGSGLAQLTPELMK